MAATHKMVNGVKVPLSPEESQAIEAEWAANPPLTAQQVLDRLRAKAAALIDLAADAQAVKDRAILLVLLDEINVLRQEVNTLRQRDVDRTADVAAATNLANLQTRWVARPALGAIALRTANQIRPAVQGKMTAGDADN